MKILKRKCQVVYLDKVNSEYLIMQNYIQASQRSFTVPLELRNNRAVLSV